MKGAGLGKRGGRGETIQIHDTSFAHDFLLGGWMLESNTKMERGPHKIQIHGNIIICPGPDEVGSQLSNFF